MSACVRERTGWCSIHGRYWPQGRPQCWPPFDPDPLHVQPEPEEEAPRSGAAVVAALAAIVAFAAGLVVGRVIA